LDPSKATRPPPTQPLDIEYVDIATLAPMAGNPRNNERAVPKVAESIRRFGWTNPILARREDRVVVAGHTRLLAAAKLGLDKVPVIWLDLDPVNAKLYSLADNKLNEVAEWDVGPLADMLRGLQEEDGVQLEDLALAGFDSKELDRLLDATKVTAAGMTDPDDMPAPVPEPYVQKGDLYQLGEHFILCGDSTAAADIDRVMQGELAHAIWTDPPWNVNYGGNGDERKGTRTIANDNLGDDFLQFLALVFAEAKRVSKPGAMVYVAMAGSEWGSLMQVLTQLEYRWSSTIIWAKDRFVLCRSDYHRQYEPIWYGWTEAATRLHPLDDRKQSDVWEVPRPQKSEEHPTMKPVELVTRALYNSSSRGDLVFEPFSGSGTTLIACEQTGRRCRAIELEPAYVQVAITRWENFTGRKAVKL
jgi:DNA modification methylase